jgi:hypothetical protein
MNRKIAIYIVKISSIIICCFNIFCYKSNPVADNKTMVSYFPIKLNNFWKYISEYSNQSTHMLYVTKGDEIWKIINFDNNSKKGKFECSFQGFKYEIDLNNNSYDTLKSSEFSIIREYNFNIPNNSLIISSNNIDTSFVMDFFTQITQEGQLCVIYPSDTLSVIEKFYSLYSGRYYRKYKLEKEIGLISFNAVNDATWGGSAVSYLLIDYSITI